MELVSSERMTTHGGGDTHSREKVQNHFSAVSITDNEMLHVSSSLHSLYSLAHSALYTHLFLLFLVLSVSYAPVMVLHKFSFPS